MTHPFITACVSALFSVSTPRDTACTIAMVGDVMMGTSVPRPQLPEEEGRGLFRDAATVLRRATLALGNCEGVLADEGRSAKEGMANAYTFRTPTRFAPRLAEAGFDYLSLGNNHSLDFGHAGLQSTRRTLDALGIAYGGLADGKEFVVLRREGRRYGICAFGHNGYTLRHTDRATVARVIAAARAQCDILIVTFHGGAEGNAARRLPQGTETFYGENRGDLRNFAHECVRLGADLVFGHGPHVPRAVELYRGRLIAYSLGNFCTPFGMNLGGYSGLAPLLEVALSSDGRFVSGRIHSLRQRSGVGPRWDKTEEAARKMQLLTATDIAPSALRFMANGELSLRQGVGAELLRQAARPLFDTTQK